jgi:hypothetical protein
MIFSWAALYTSFSAASIARRFALRAGGGSGVIPIATGTVIIIR